METILTPEAFTFAIGIIVSIVFELWPRAKSWYDKNTSGKKFLFMNGVGLGFAAVVFGAGCFALFSLDKYMTCDVAGAESILKLWGAYFLGNQGTFGTMHAIRKNGKK